MRIQYDDPVGRILEQSMVLLFALLQSFLLVLALRDIPEEHEHHQFPTHTENRDADLNGNPGPVLTHAFAFKRETSPRCKLIVALRPISFL